MGRIRRVLALAVTLAALLRKNRLVFIDSALEHNDVVAGGEQLRAFLTASALPPGDEVLARAG